MSSLDRILPFLRPIADLLVDPDITEVMVNAGGRRVFVERNGMLEAVPDRTLETRNLTVAIKNIARACGDDISDMQPILDARLEDGSRVAAMFLPCSVDGPTLTVRKFTRRYTLADLVAVGTIGLLGMPIVTEWPQPDPADFLQQVTDLDPSLFAKLEDHGRAGLEKRKALHVMDDVRSAAIYSLTCHWLQSERLDAFFESFGHALAA